MNGIHIFVLFGEVSTIPLYNVIIIYLAPMATLHQLIAAFVTLASPSSTECLMGPKV